MLKDLRLFRRNSGKHLLEGNENLPTTEPDSSLLVSDPGRPPLCSIPEPTQKPKSAVEQDLGFRSKIEGTPLRNKGKNSDARAIYRTPEKRVGGSPAPPLSLRNRFGWGQKSELNFNGSETCDEVGQGTDHFPPRVAGPGNGDFLISPRVARTAGTGRTTSSQSESCSTQNTPSKSVTKPPNPAFLHSNGSRNPLISGARGGNCSLMSRGISSSSVPSTVVNTVEVPHFELREDPLFWMDHNVQVLIRIRPPNCTERSLHGYNRCLKQDSAQTITWIGQPETRFKFDHVACETVNQEMLFRVAGLPMVQNCMSGYNSCMFAYGQTGSGKTYTMLGEIDELDVHPSLDRGMTPRIFEFLFAKIREEEENRRDEKLKYNCKCSFLEIYNEQITDLLDPSSSNLLLREDVRKGVYVENLTESEVESVNDILKLLMQGAANRKVAATNMNRESSRSHSVFTCVIESRWENDSTTNLRYARLNLVDLAGSERQKASGAEGERLKEAANINKSLSALGHVIMVLVDLAQGKQRHVPYRDSRLTFLLQDSLGGNSKTMIIANVSPSISCAAETLSTLKFAQRAKLIQNNAVVNEDASGDVIALQHQITLLKEELSFLKHSRSLSFCSPMVDDSNTERSDAVPEEKKPNMDCVNIDDSQERESFDIVRVSTKQLKSLETILTGALRREQMADITTKQLQAEIEQLNRLVRQREDETRCTKMMLRFRDEKIRRMESLVDGLLPADSYLIEQNSFLAEEIHLLQTRVDKNPEVTRFASENVRLLDQLRRFQDFYEEGEREILLSEISELRDQLYKFLEGKSELSKLPRCMDSVAQENSQFGFARTNKEKDPLYIELKKTREELDDCRRNLTSCLEINAKLTRDIDHLNSQLNSLKSAYHSQDANIELQKDLLSASPFKQSQKHLLGVVQEDAAPWKHELAMKHAEEIMKLQLELDIVRIIHDEERSCRCEVEQRASQLSKDLEVAKDELMGAKSIIEALESQQILSISEIEELRDINNQYAELHGRRDPTLKASENEDSPLQAKLKRMQASLEKARLLNTRYQGDQASQISNEQEMDEIRSQVEAETAEVIVCLQEELSSLHQQVDESSKNELETRKENIQLCKLLEERDEECKMLTEEWDKLVSEVSEVLADGDVALEEVSDQVEVIVDSFQQRTWVGEQVGRMVRIISEKELLIEELQKGMEDAYKIRGDLEWKLRSLRGATLAITEAQQQENCEKEKEVLQLTSKLSEQKSLVDELENKIKQRDDQIRSAEVRATVAFMMTNRLSEINSVRLEEMKKKESQLIQAFKLKLEQSEEDQERVRIMESRFSDDILKTKERLDEFKMRLSTLSSCMSDCTENVEVSNNMTRLEKDECNSDEGNYGGLILSERVQFISRNDSEMISENATESDATILLLRKEIESALDSLSAVQAQVTNLLGEKEEFKKSERQNFKNIEYLRDQVLKMQIDMSDLQRQFQLGALELAQKLQTVQDMAEKARVVLEVQLNEAKAAELQKTAEALNLLTKFEEAQATMQEADVMINALVMANEAAKHEIERGKEIETSVRKERDQLINEVQILRSSNNLKDQQYEDLAAQFHSNLAETGSLVQAFDDILKQVEITFKEESESILCDIQNLKSELLHSMNLAKIWLEDIWSEIIVKDCAMSVLHLCHIGVLLEMLTGLNAEKGLLHHGLTESNSVIADLREHNFRAKKELQMCSVLKGKLLIDIRNSFQRIARKEEEADKLSTKINLFEKKILDVQMQEESMLAFSNYMELELVDIRHSNSVTVANLEAKKQEQALLVGKLQAAEEDNAKLKIELRNLKAENSRVYEYLQGKKSESESYSSHLLERLSSLEACITCLSNDLDTKNSKLEEAKHSHLVIAKENGSLVSELMLSKQRNDEMLTSLKLNARCCYETVQAVDSFGKKMFHVIMTEDNKDIMLSDKMFQEICYYEESAQKFIAESHLLEKSVKEIISEKLYLQSELELEHALLVGKLQAAEEDNAKLKIELGNLKAENSRVYEDLQGKKSEFESYSSHLLERLSSLEACITCLSNDLDTKNSKLDEAKHSLLVIAKENGSLVNELMLNKQKNDEMLTSLKLNARCCYETVQAVDSFGKKMFHVIMSEDDKYIMLSDKMFQEICYYEESVQKFIAESHLLEKSAKEIISEKLYLQSELEQEQALLVGKLQAAEEDNVKLKIELGNLKAENSRVYEDLQGKKLESESNSSHLLERLSTLEACITCLSSDLETKSSKLEEEKHSHLVIAKENESLVRELMLSKQKNDEMLTSLKLNARRCYDTVQAVDSFGKKVLQVIMNEDNKDIMLLDKMFQEICYYVESAQKFLAESQSLEKSVKEIISEKLYLQSELERKEEIMKGLSFDLSLLQESASNVMDQKDEFEELLGTLESLEEDLTIRSNELDEALAHGQFLEAQLHEKMNTISTLELDLAKAQEWLQLVSGENLDLKAQMEDLLLIKNSTEERLTEKSKMTERLEEQVQEMGVSLGQMDDFLESMKCDLIKVTNDKDCLESEVLVLKEQLEMAQGLAEENEAIATEAQQMAEASKAYSVDKEEEAKLLEKSVEELECTINILENKVEVVKGEAQRQRLQREELEIELQAVKHQMLTVHASNDLSRTSGEKNKDVYEAQRKIEILEHDLEEKEAEIIKCKRHISELNMHAESQAREYMQKFKALEAMAQQVKPEPNASYNVASSTTTKPEKNAAKSRGSGSPFKCIGLGLAQQVNSEKDEELTAGRLRIEELEALASSRQKEIFMLNTRLAAAESMTHDVIRDLLGVKLDMSNYASLLDHEEVQKIAEKARLHSDESLQKEVVKLKQQLNEFIEERQGWLDEINRKHSEMVAARVAVEKLRREDQFITTENEKLKLENANYHKKVMELEGELKKLSGQQNLQQRIHHHAKIKEENNSLRVQNEDLSVKLRRNELTLSRVKEELARYRASSGKIPYIDIDEEQRLKNQLKDTDEERVQLAQQLLGLCTSILKAAGITHLVADICPSMAEEALNQLKDRVASSERELQDLKYKNKISGEKMRLSELRQQSPPPLSTRTTQNCSTPKRLSQAPLSPLSR